MKRCACYRPHETASVTRRVFQQQRARIEIVALQCQQAKRLRLCESSIARTGSQNLRLRLLILSSQKPDLLFYGCRMWILLG